MDFFTNLSPWHWWALGVLCFAIEIVAPSAFFIWPGAAALIVGIVLWLQPEMGWMLQFFTFSLLSVASLVVWRAGPWRKAGLSDHPLLNRRGAQYVGRTATVVADFENGRGHVELDDTRWGAVSDDATNPENGSIVTVTAVEGTMLRVKSDT